jgi:hypothetical protein
MEVAARAMLAFTLAPHHATGAGQSIGHDEIKRPGKYQSQIVKQLKVEAADSSELCLESPFAEI